MKLSLKLPLLFAAAVLTVSAAGVFGIQTLDRSLDTFTESVQANHGHERAASAVSGAFKVQIQEWKNVLLRGKDPAAFDKHWKAFEARERDVTERARALAQDLGEGELKAQVERFMAAHASMGQRYRASLDAFKASGFDPAAGDKAVRGMDRDAVKLLEETTEAIGASSAAIARAAIASGRRATPISLGLMLATGLAGVVVAFGLSRRIVRPLQRAVKTAEQVAAGDLSVPVRVGRSGDEVDQLLASLQQMQNQLSGLVRSLRVQSEQVAAASVQLASGNLELGQRTETQASALQEAAASMEQFGGTIRQSAAQAREASALAEEATRAATEGGAVVGQVIATMQGINESSARIADIIGVIDGIAFQTNMLALNAAVEAARAGEQGRGFAVVASEVRSLAGRSADAAREIKQLITASGERVAQGSALVDQAGRTIDGVVSQVTRLSGIVTDMSATSAEQQAGIDQVTGVVIQLEGTTQQNAALVEEGSATAQSLREQAQALSQAIAIFKVSA